MWSADAVPSDFEFPDDPRTSVDPQPGFAWPLEIESTPGGVRVRWEWHAEPPDSFAFTVATDALQWRCRLGAIASRLEAVHQEIVLHSPCLRAPESLGGQLEVWAEWRDGRKTLAANAPLGDGSAALCVRFEPYSNPLNVTRRVRFYLATDASIAIETLDASGRLLDRQWLGRRPAGWQSILWPSSRECLRTLPSGVYWLRVRAGHQSGSCRFCLVR
jgi:hypothetical protein